ncbi:GH36 C-terminal domain-containing protein [Arthrobacter sp. ZGTC131]|uniref:GH36 C-terminal domain-containing protein n=1 Tax=Arthrobacter sp. ZGTC131 TaxID=2058898 RepID=UPI0021578CE9|nr:GH36 C-terminal domain-containing protein [Arthrobacter sp. ZGTC131]
MAHGVVSADRSRAIFAVAALDSLYPDPAGRLKLRGLDPDATYRVESIFPGPHPRGYCHPNGGASQQQAAAQSNEHPSVEPHRMTSSSPAPTSLPASWHTPVSHPPESTRTRWFCTASPRPARPPANIFICSGILSDCAQL